MSIAFALKLFKFNFKKYFVKCLSIRLTKCILNKLKIHFVGTEFTGIYIIL